MYIELTPLDTLKDLKNLLINSLSLFEFPRFPIDNYTIDISIKPREEILTDDFVIGLVQNDLESEENNEIQQFVYVDNSKFNFELTSEEINIIAYLMLSLWTQRQVTSIENTRMKYSASDFKMTSQANHLQKLMSLLDQCQKQSRYLQRLYKRRRLIQNESSPYNGMYRSNWDTLGRGVYYDRYGN